jgi:hypothetical protein
MRVVMDCIWKIEKKNLAYLQRRNTTVGLTCLINFRFFNDDVYLSDFMS